MGLMSKLFTVLCLPAIILMIVSVAEEGGPSSDYKWAFGSWAKCGSWGGVFVTLSTIANVGFMLLFTYGLAHVLRALPPAAKRVIRQSNYSALVELGRSWDNGPESTPEGQVRAEAAAALGAQVSEVTGLQVVDTIIHGHLGIVTMQTTDG